MSYIRNRLTVILTGADLDRLLLVEAKRLLREQGWKPEYRGTDGAELTGCKDLACNNPVQKLQVEVSVWVKP